MNFECRSNVGVLIGCVNVLGFTATLIYVIKVLCDFGKISEEVKRRNQDVISKPVTILYIILAICIIAIILSGLLIAGIIKKRHALMRPWLICAFAGIICHTFRLVVGLFSGSLSGAPAGDVALSFIVGLLTLGLQILIFYIIYKLYKIIRDKRNTDQSTTEREETALNAINDNPPSYADLERNGQLSKTNGTTV